MPNNENEPRRNSDITQEEIIGDVDNEATPQDIEGIKDEINKLKSSKATTARVDKLEKRIEELENSYLNLEERVGVLEVNDSTTEDDSTKG